MASAIEQTFVPDDAVCLRCGYPLRGLRDQTCPECGVAFDPTDRASYRRSVERLRWCEHWTLTPLCLLLLVNAALLLSMTTDFDWFWLLGPILLLLVYGPMAVIAVIAMAPVCVVLICEHVARPTRRNAVRALIGLGIWAACGLVVELVCRSGRC